jgi:hypothetical protein
MQAQAAADNDKARIEMQTMLFQARAECERLENEVGSLLQNNQTLLADNSDIRR